MYYTYVLKSTVAQVTHVGCADDIDRVLDEHNSGKYGETKGYAPWKLVYKEAYKSCIEARKREKFFKSNPGSQFLKNIWEIV